jgi:hypothetical protein
MNRIWFKRFGWFHLPVSWQGAAIVVLIQGVGVAGACDAVVRVCAVGEGMHVG